MPLVAVGGDAADVPLGIDHGPQSTGTLVGGLFQSQVLWSADSDEAESVRARFRERVSSPCGDDGEVDPAGHPPGGGGRAEMGVRGYVGSRARQESKGQRVTRDSKVELQEYRGVWESVGSRAR